MTWTWEEFLALPAEAVMSGTETRLDGNAAAGAFSELLVPDLTRARACWLEMGGMVSLELPMASPGRAATAARRSGARARW